MEKKNYIAPEVEVVMLDMWSDVCQMVVTSGDTPGGWDPDPGLGDGE